MLILFVSELTRHFPALSEIELDGYVIRFYNSKVARIVPASRSFRLTFRKQSTPNTLFPMFAKRP